MVSLKLIYYYYMYYKYTICDKTVQYDRIETVSTPKRRLPFHNEMNFTILTTKKVIFLKVS